MNARNLLLKSNRSPYRAAIAACAIGVIAVVTALYFLLWESNSVQPSPSIVTISRGENFAQVIDAFTNAGLINHPVLFKIGGKLFGYAGKIKIGKYSFADGVSNRQILYAISTGTSTANPEVTIYEGLRSAHVERILKREVGIDSAKMAELIADTSLIHLSNHGAASLEGFLLPETYEFYWQVDEKEIYARCCRNFENFLPIPSNGAFGRCI